MTKQRVYEVARELGLPNRAIVERIEALGIEVRNHMTALEPADVERVKRALKGAGTTQEKVVEERIRPTVVRRRAVVKREPVAEEPPTETPAAAAAAAPAPVVEATPAAVAAQKPAAAPAEAPEPEVKVAEPAVTAPEPAAEAPAPVAEASPAPAAKPDAKAEPEDVPPSALVQPAQTPEDPMTAQPASVRLAHGNLPPGVVARGKTQVQGTSHLSDSVRQRIVSEHAARRADLPRRRELGRAALGPMGRPQARPGKRRALPGRKGKQTEITTPSAQKRLIRIEDNVQLQTLAQRLSAKSTEVLMKLMQMGMTGVHINSTLDADTAQLLASEFGYEVENVAVSEEELVTQARGEFDDREEDRVTRAPIITVMGHVDHGKTSLLDYIRKADVVRGEAGGITQHIGSYRVETASGPIVFLDTPGHEAFTSLRARGAQATDIVILVVAADDGVMPQTKEAIAHAKSASVPILVALNKCDKPDARPDQIKQELSGEGLQPEEWGGETMFFEVSAATGANIDKLLEGVALQAEVLELTANPAIPAAGVVLEAYLDRGRGPVANVLVRNGTLNTGDAIVVGSTWGRVRAMTNDRNKTIKTAGPATPIEVLGLSDLPMAGDPLYVVTDAKRAQEIGDERRRAAPQTSGAPALSLDALQQMMQAGEVQELKVVLKADVHGSLEALQKSLTELTTSKVKVNVIHSGVGGITENDVMLASASNALIVGFNVRPAGQAASTAKSESIEIRMYTVIYEAIGDVKAAMAGLLDPEYVEEDIGRAQVREIFSIPKLGAIAGCLVDNGKVLRNGKARLVRDSIVLWTGNVGSLRRFKDDVKEVANGYECGIRLEGYTDLKPGDVIEAFQLKEVAPSLD